MICHYVSTSGTLHNRQADDHVHDKDDPDLGTHNDYSFVSTTNSLSREMTRWRRRWCWPMLRNRERYLRCGQCHDQVETSVKAPPDTVRSKLASYTLSTNVENLQIDWAMINGTGNDLAINHYRQWTEQPFKCGNDDLTNGLGNDFKMEEPVTIAWLAMEMTLTMSILHTTPLTKPAGGIDTVIASFNASWWLYLRRFVLKDFTKSRIWRYMVPVLSMRIGSTSNNILIGMLDNKLYGLLATIPWTAVLLRHHGRRWWQRIYYVENIDVIIDASGTDTVVAYLNNYTLGTGSKTLPW